MRRIVTGEDARVVEWVLQRMPDTEDFGPCTAIGLEQNGELIAGVVYSDYRPDCWIMMHVAAEPGKLWASPWFLFHCFHYPFVQLNLRRVTALVDEANQKALRFDLRLGFELEGRLRQATPEGRDIFVLGMLRDDCRWLPQPVLKGDSHGQA